jgi:hypothetical protein
LSVEDAGEPLNELVDGLLRQSSADLRLDGRCPCDVRDDDRPTTDRGLGARGASTRMSRKLVRLAAFRYSSPESTSATTDEEEDTNTDTRKRREIADAKRELQASHRAARGREIGGRKRPDWRALLLVRPVSFVQT